MKWHFSARWPVCMCVGALSPNTCPRCNGGVCEAFYHQVTMGNRWVVSVPVCLWNRLTDQKPSSETATNVLPCFMVRTQHIFSKGLRKYAIILNHSQENHEPLNKCLFRYRTWKYRTVDPHWHSGSIFKACFPNESIFAFTWEGQREQGSWCLVFIPWDTDQSS